MPTTLDVGGLRFLSSDAFQSIGDDYFVNTGTVSIGYTPAGSENFLPLVQAKLLASGGSSHNAFTLMPNQTTPSFEIAHTELDLVVVGGSPSIPLPIWKSTDPDFTETFALGELKTTGVLLGLADSEPITGADVDFTLNTLLFHNPDSGTTANAQVKMQGDASFDKVPLVKDLGIAAHVGGPNDLQNNYVIADHAGITLTGLDVTKDLPSNLKVAGLAVSGTVTIGYSHADNSFTFGGTVHLTSDDQGSDQVALNNVAATLEVTVSGGQLGTFGFGISGGFHIFDLNVSTTNERPFLFQYNGLKDQFEISGGLQLEFNFNTISATLDDGMGGPGILIENGQLTQFHAIFNADITLFGATIDATNLTFEYTAAHGLVPSQFEMYGDLSLTIPTSNQADTKITAHLGTQADPGLVLQNGTLTQINMGLGGSFDVFGFHIAAAGANLEWQKADNTFLISGAFMADFRVFQVSVTLGDSPTTGLIIKDGHFRLQDAKFELDNATLGPVTLEQLVVQWQAQGNNGDFNIDVGGKVLLPGGWEVDAALVFDQKGLESIAVSATLGEGIPIADTGLFITELGGSIKNLENPSQIIVTAHLGVTWGETFNLFGKEVKLFRAEGDITVDANELILSGSVQLGAYSPDNGTTWQAVAGSGDAKLVLDWGDKLYSLHMDVNGMFGFIDLSGDVTFNVGKEIKFLATAAVVIPSEVPFIGGDKIAGVGFSFDHVFKHDNVDTSTTVAAWIELHIIWDFEVGFEYVYNDTYPNGHFALIGAGTIDNFQAEALPPVDQTYTYTADLGGLVPANATSATLSADWSKPASGVTIVGQPKFRVQRTLNGHTQTFTEDQFAANGIQLINDPHFSSPTKKAIQIVGSTTNAYAPITGDYKLLVDVTTEGGKPFPDYPNPNAADVLKIQATSHVPKPTFGPRNVLAHYVPVVPPTPSGTFPVTLQGTIDEGFLTSGKAQVSLYRVLAQDPQQKGVLLGTRPLTRVSGNGVNWQATVNVPVEGLYPLPYTVYAVVNDGFNVPVKTASSAAFTPAFAVFGSVSNQAHEAKTGWSVFLDYNQDGKHQSNEPLYQTSDPDGFYAFTPTFDPSTGWDPVPVGKPFNVQLIVPAPENFATVTPVPVTYDGQNTNPVPFVVQEKSAIKGTVFEDVHGTGLKKDGTPIPSATVYLDVNHSGHQDPGDPTTLTDAGGNYAFANQAPGTYTVALDVDSLSEPVAAYNVRAGTVGQGFSRLSSYGMDFDVNQAIWVTSLGLFDSGQSGWDSDTLPYFASLYDRRTQNVLATVDFTTSDPGTLMGGSRFKPLPKPLLLPAGFQGTIAGNVQFGDKKFGSWNDQPVTWTTNNDQGAVTFVGSGRFGAEGAFPTQLDTGPPNAYAAGTFLYSSPVWVQTSPPSGTYTVTIDNSGFDLSEGNDFGALPSSLIEGTVAGHALGANGHLQQATTPLAGWTVQLLDSNKQVIATTTTQDDGSYVFATKPGTYTVRQVVEPGWRQLVPTNSPPELQKGNRPIINGPAAYVVTADFDRDGNMDFALIDGFDANITFGWGHGDGTFTLTSTKVSFADPLKMVALDYNHDGLLDLAVISAKTWTLDVLVNQGNRTFVLLRNPYGLPDTQIPDAAQDLVGGDFDNDGFADDVFYVNTSQAQLLIKGQLPRTMFTLPANGQRTDDFLYFHLLAAGDFANNDTQDVVVNALVSQPPGLVKVSGANTGDYVNLPFSNGGGAVDVGDINGDGNLDIALFSETSTPLVYMLGAGNGTFSAAVVVPASFPIHNVNQVFLRDFDGDGKPDLAYLLNGSVTIYRNRGQAPYFSVDDTVTIPLNLNDGLFLASADFNNDGLPDLLAAEYQQSVSVYLNTTKGPNGSVGLTVTIPPPQQVVVGKDFLNAQLPKRGGVLGTVFDDRNRNGGRDAGESGQAGTFVYLDTNANGQYEPGEPVTTTVEGGAYAFDNLADGTYRVGVIPDPGKQVTSAGGGFQDVTVVGSAVLGIDFGQSDRLLQSVADQHATVGTPLNVAVALTNAGATGNRLVFALEPGGPAGASIDPVTGRITWLPTTPGQFPVTVRVRDLFQPVRTETTTFLVTVNQHSPVIPPPPPSGPFAVPVLERLVVNRNRQRGTRAQLLGTTLIFNVPVNLDPRALRLVRHRPGKRSQDLSPWIRIIMVVQNGQTWAHLRFRSPRGGLLPKGRYSLTLQNDLVRNALTGTPQADAGGNGLTEVFF